MDSHILKTHPDSTIECRQLSEEFLEETLSLMEKVYFAEEKIVGAFGLTQDSQTIFEERQVMKNIIEDGVSVIAIDKNNNNKVIGACLNKIHVKPGSGEETFYGKIAKSSKASAIKSITEFDDYVIRKFFELCQVDCVLEFTMIGILPEYRNRGIAKTLYQIVIDLGRVLAKGVNAKKSVDGRELAVEPVPETIVGVCTSEKAWQVGEDMGFKLVATLDYEKFKCEEKTLADVQVEEISVVSMINYRHQDLLNDDVLWVVRILGGKIFHCGVVKFVIKLTLSLYSFLLLAQTYFFVFAPDADQLIQYGPLFFQMCYATLGMFVVLLRNRMIEDVMEVIDLWDVKSAGEEVEIDDDDQVFFTNWLMQKWFFGHTKCLIVLIKLTFFVAAPCMTVHGYQIIYTLQHVKFQMYMFNKYVEELTKGFTTCECKLLFDEVYQNEVNFRLKFLIKRHCDFLR
uniref:N-acetyltransferase domain-containing protein n=1 Tax=Tenebrio molitor TaxID=7067 RepID=A0A8J6H346_TENMO|nr:hypothetical protein GEV33_015538 [Tenebrio molitor]